MLTPQEITEKVFVKAVFGGYDMTGVDDFLEAVAADYAALYKENAILKGKLKVLVEKVEEYRSTEDAMRMALLTAQRMGEEITVEANKLKEETLRNADKMVQDKLAETAKRVADEELRLNVAAKETAKFIALSQAIMRKHSEFLTKLETARRAVRPDPEPPPPSSPHPPSTSTSPSSTYEDQVADAAAQIDSAMEKLAGFDSQTRANGSKGASAPKTEFDDEGEPTKPYNSNSGKNGDDSVTPRPKFDFDDLKFGANFDKNHKSNKN
ncbi:MAG: DivIVA domain-containing protein [Oscillospiraceae bacterium]|nr:DivIVA domain-containing protein [Oscillospiraceae bacterium]